MCTLPNLARPPIYPGPLPERLPPRGVPKSIGNLRLWLDASHIAGLADGAALASWTDLSGNGSHATQSTPAAQPTFYANVLNGRPGVQFDGTADCLQAASVTFSLLTAFAVFQISGNGLVYEHGPGGADTNNTYLYTTTANTLFFRRNTTNDSAKNYIANWGSDNAAKIARHTYGGTHATHTLHVNGALATLTNVLAGEPGASSVTAALNIGSRNQTTAFVTGYLFELILYDAALDGGQCRRIERYLSTKWGIDLAA